MKFPLLKISSTVRPFYVLIAVLAVATVLVSCSSDYPTPVYVESPECEDLTYDVLPVTNLTLSTDGLEVSLQAEVANKSSERTQGLMCRESIPVGTGMLFTYQTDRTNGFWMYNTYVPIDILYIDQAGHVVDKLTMSPCIRESENESDDDWKVKCATEANNYVPSEKWRYVLELPADWLIDQNIGDSVALTMNVSWPDLEVEE